MKKLLTDERLSEIKEMRPNMELGPCSEPAMDDLIYFAEQVFEHSSAFLTTPNVTSRFTKEEALAIMFTEILLRRSSGPDPEWATEAGVNAAKKLLTTIRS